MCHVGTQGAHHGTERELILPRWMTMTWQQDCVTGGWLEDGREKERRRGGGERGMRNVTVCVLAWGLRKKCWRWGWLRWGRGHKLCICTCCFGLLYLWDSVHSKSQGSKEGIKGLQWMEGRDPRRWVTHARLPHPQVPWSPIQFHLPTKNLWYWATHQNAFISHTRTTVLSGMFKINRRYPTSMPAVLLDICVLASALTCSDSSDSILWGQLTYFYHAKYLNKNQAYQHITMVTSF